MSTARGTAIVTGGARGIGAATSTRLLQDGYSVVIADILTAEGQQLADSLDGPVSFHELDVTKPEQWTGVVAKAEEQFGPVTALVNNAGIAVGGPFENQDLVDYERVIAVNQTGVFLGMQSVIPSMRKAGHGAIVNISSVAGFIAFAGVMGYVASKWAVRGMTKAAALELGQYNIRVTSVHPGIIDTPIIAGTETAAQTAHQPIPRPGEPDDIAGAVSYLLSPDAKYVTGSELIVDGGFTSL